MESRVFYTLERTNFMMSQVKEKKLSRIFSFYFVTIFIICASGLLIWTYTFTDNLIEQELENNFSQQHAIVKDVVEQQFRLLGLTAHHLAADPSLQQSVYENNQNRTKKILSHHLDYSEIPALDILFTTHQGSTLITDRSSPSFDVQSILPEISKQQTKLLNTGRLLPSFGNG